MNPTEPNGLDTHVQPSLEPPEQALPPGLFTLAPDGSVARYDPSLEPLVQALRAQAPDTTKVNAMLAALQQQRDSALHQVVLLSADLAVASEKLGKLALQLATPSTPPH